MLHHPQSHLGQHHAQQHVRLYRTGQSEGLARVVLALPVMLQPFAWHSRQLCAVLGYLCGWMRDQPAHLTYIDVRMAAHINCACLG